MPPKVKKYQCQKSVTYVKYLYWAPRPAEGWTPLKAVNGQGRVGCSYVIYTSNCTYIRSGKWKPLWKIFNMFHDLSWTYSCIFSLCSKNIHQILRFHREDARILFILKEARILPRNIYQLIFFFSGLLNFSTKLQQEILLQLTLQKLKCAHQSNESHVYYFMKFHSILCLDCVSTFITRHRWCHAINFVS